MVHDAMLESGHEQVTHFVDEETGLRAIVAIHDTTLGPALGGTRLLPYETEADALRDVMRLSRAMTYKAAAADLELGGGKAVIVDDPDEKTEAKFRAYGRMVDRLGGHYITSVDVNTGVAEMDVVAEGTDHVVGTSDGLGDPSPVTARGIFSGIRASVETVYGTDDFDDRTVVVQGVGKVGQNLVGLLREAGATVKVSDVDEAAVESVVAEYGVESVAPEDVYDEPCDVFAPCAVGGVINDETIPRLDCDVVAGGANNVLAERRHAADLHERGILYAPDYVINAGGLITVAKEHEGGTMADAMAEAEAIGDRLLDLIGRAEDHETTVLDAAERYARERIGGADEARVASPQ
ncbi:Leu/Phe/Val dehydrogenase [Salinilacihabitans rarus]|uniref:Leu/Phe/Val dehydrogenase n=1 Tax=Salinilacihabitans rarus TaxID=2961596 RepID=UPI0020C8797F|nr:Glu/Leu/Phe/Val dehydrogenase dimerization domain-containing protein [Salinilacihabitans rarus]